MTAGLRSEDWSQVPFDEVVLPLVRGEAHKFEHVADEDRRCICNPDLDDPQQNMRRCELLAQIRGGLFCGVPPDTMWHEVCYLRNHHLNELRAMREPNWIDTVDQNELE